MTPDEAIAISRDVSAQEAGEMAVSMGPERFAALMLAMDWALRGGCWCECCVSVRAIYEGVA